MPRRRRKCASVAEAAQRIEELEGAVEAATESLAQAIAALSAVQTDIAAMNKRVRVLESAQPSSIGS